MSRFYHENRENYEEGLLNPLYVGKLVGDSNSPHKGLGEIVELDKDKGVVTINYIDDSVSKVEIRDLVYNGSFRRSKPL